MTPLPRSRYSEAASRRLATLLLAAALGSPLRASEPEDTRIPLNLDFARPSLVDARRPWGWALWGMDRAGVTVEVATGADGGAALRLDREEDGAPAAASYALGTIGAGRRAAVAGRVRTHGEPVPELRLGLEVASPSGERSRVWAAPACLLEEAEEPCRAEVEVPADAQAVAVVIELEGAGTATVGPLTLTLDGEAVGDVLPGQEEPPAAAVAAARARAIPLASSDPAAPLDELSALDPLFGDAPFVLLGESTHGTREFFTWKHRMVRYLAERKGFTVFVLEDHWGPARAIDRFVRTGEGDPEALVAGLFRVWERREMVDLIRWMRRANASGAARIGFEGVDLQDPRAPAAAVEAFLREHDPELAGEASAAYAPMVAAWEEGPYPSREPEEHSRWSEAARRVLERMEAGAEGHRLKAGDAAAGEARFVARLAWQSAELARAGSAALRDRYMAENLSWIRGQQPPGTRLVVWAHNAHVRAAAGSMGQYLRELHPGEVAAFGLLTYEGSYAAYRPDGREVFPLLPAPPESVEYLLHRTGLPVLALPLGPRTAAAADPALAWLEQPRWERAIGYAPVDFGFTRQPVAELYDALLFVDRSEAARPLDEP